MFIQLLAVVIIYPTCHQVKMWHKPFYSGVPGHETKPTEVVLLGFKIL